MDFGPPSCTGLLCHPLLQPSHEGHHAFLLHTVVETRYVGAGLENLRVASEQRSHLSWAVPSGFQEGSFCCFKTLKSPKVLPLTMFPTGLIASWSVIICFFHRERQRPKDEFMLQSRHSALLYLFLCG